MTTTRKELKALTTGADYSVKGAGATSLFMSLLGLCVSIPNPISLAVAGGVGLLCCCAGTYTELKHPDPEIELEQKIDDIENKLDLALNPGRDIQRVQSKKMEEKAKTHPSSEVESTSYCAPLSIFCCKSKVKSAPESSYVPPPPSRMMMDDQKVAMDASHPIR
jgi:hypothetical protein